MISNRRVSRRFVGVLLVFACPAFAADEKKERGKPDPAIPMTGNAFRPVFVRMVDQLFRKAGDYEVFCAKRTDLPRSRNRAEVLPLLRAKAEGAWKTVDPLVAELEKAEKLKGVRRFWIVNGFSCAARPEAIRSLAASEAVSFVYLDRFARPQSEAKPMREAELAAMKALEEMRRKSPVDTDVKDAKIPWNLQALRVPEAWSEVKTKGRGATVAVIDSGVLPTPSLARALWRNPKETFNGEDDDGNGLADDVFGYDFAVGNGFVLESGASGLASHGSACAGIIAGRPSPRSKWLTGVAPEAELMLLKGSFDLRALEYLLAHGADVVSMSFMIVGRDLGHLRGLYRNAFEHLGAAGVLSVGGAGNFGAGPRAQPVGKQIGLPKDIPCVVAVAGVSKDGKLVPFSSKGPCFWDDIAFFSDYPKKEPLGKPDLAAFPTGYPVWTRPPGRVAKLRGWREIAADEGASLVVGPAGNSFSGPHAAGVAALVLSVNPELNPWEVKELLEASAVDLGPKGRDFRTGAGLLDARAAVEAARKLSRK